MIIKRSQNTKSDIIKLLKSVKRKGIDNVIDFLENSDYFSVGGSETGRHGNFIGGLAEHSLSVFKIAKSIFESNYFKKNANIDFTIDSLIICCLLHDICKVNDERFNQLSGHGGKSVKILSRLGLELTEKEELAIKYHMGPVNNLLDYKKVIKAMGTSPLIGLIWAGDTIAAWYIC